MKTTSDNLKKYIGWYSVDTQGTDHYRIKVVVPGAPMLREDLQHRSEAMGHYNDPPLPFTWGLPSLETDHAAFSLIADVFKCPSTAAAHYERFAKDFLERAAPFRTWVLSSREIENMVNGPQDHSRINTWLNTGRVNQNDLEIQKGLQQ